MASRVVILVTPYCLPNIASIHIATLDFMKIMHNPDL